MRAGLTALLCLCMYGLPLSAAEPLPAQIHVVSEVWEGHTNADGTGLAWEIVRKVYEPAGVQLKLESLPYTRSIGLVQRGQADAWIGAYHREVEDAIFPQWNYDVDQVFALGLLNNSAPTLETLGSYRLIWLRGYGYQNQLPNVRAYTELQRQTGVLDMLKKHRADLYLDEHGQIQALLAKAAQPALYRITLLASLPIYLGFSPNARGQQLADLFDQRMAELVKSGELRPIFQHWQQPYPFVKESP